MPYPNYFFKCHIPVMLVPQKAKKTGAILPHDHLVKPSPALLLSFNQVEFIFSMESPKMHISVWGFRGFRDGWHHFEDTKDILEAPWEICHEGNAQNLPHKPAQPPTSTALLLTNVWQRLPNVSISSRIFQMLLPPAHVAAAFVVLPWKAGNSAAAFLPLHHHAPARGDSAKWGPLLISDSHKCLESHSVHKNILIILPE